MDARRNKIVAKRMIGIDGRRTTSGNVALWLISGFVKMKQPTSIRNVMMKMTEASTFAVN